MKIKKLILPSLLITPFVSTITTASCANSSISLVIYAQNGTFKNGSNILHLNTKENTQLKDVVNYEIPEPKDGNLSFYKWADSQGNTIKDTTPITQNTVVIAQYAEKITTTNDFSKDNWRTVISHTYSELDFAKTYCGYTGDSKEEAISKINEWILTEANQKEIDLSYIEVKVKPKVRIAGINQDNATDVNLNKPLFTFEFINGIDIFAYDLERYDEKTETLWNYEYDNSTIRYRLNEFLIYMLPTVVCDAIVPVNKITQKCIFGPAQYYTTSDKMFLFSCSEINAKMTPTSDFPLEGKTYTYYNRNLPAKSYIKINACSKKKEIYFLRTPATPIEYDDQKLSASVIDVNGKLWDYNKRDCISICPGFCI